jgi:predicted glycosyltransferase
MNREAAALGVPAASVYAGKWAAIDEELVKDGRLRKIDNREGMQTLTPQKKEIAKPRNAKEVRAQIIELILE